MYRPRRLRKSKAIRNLVSDCTISVNHLIYPLFITEGKGIKEPISSLKGQFRYSLDTLGEAVKELKEIGLKQLLLFGVVPDGLKDATGSYGIKKEQVVNRAIAAIKEVDDSFLIFTDVCLCGYTTHGHCGIIRESGVKSHKSRVEILNDETLQYLSDMACSHAEAGADFVAPSSMMDYQVKAIREGLDGSGFKDVGIMSYSAKFLSAFYGPFRSATGNSPKITDRSTYQVPPDHKKQALFEMETDLEEGADIVMIKPAMLYLDIIQETAQMTTAPIAAYNVSGEYAMIKASVDAGLIDEASAIKELFTGIRRAGANMIISYFARDSVKNGIVGQ